MSALALAYVDADACPLVIPDLYGGYRLVRESPMVWRLVKAGVVRGVLFQPEQVDVNGIDAPGTWWTCTFFRGIESATLCQVFEHPQEALAAFCQEVAP